LALRLTRGDEEAWHPFFCALEQVALPFLKRQWLRLDGHQRFEEAEDAARTLLLRVQEKLKRDDHRALKAHFASPPGDGPTGRDTTAAAEPAPRARGSFKAYLRAILIRATIDYQRGHPHFRRASQAKVLANRPKTSASAADKAGWISFVSAHSGIDASVDPVTLMNTAGAMLSYLDEANEIARSLSLAAARDGSTAALKPQAVCEEIARRLALQRPRKGGAEEPDVEAARHLLKYGASYRQAIELHVHGWHQGEIGEALGLTRRVTQRLLVRAQAVLRARFAPPGAGCSHSASDG
jgi:DNA-directed RNA polymerase specialized sigma24 family protein